MKRKRGAVGSLPWRSRLPGATCHDLALSYLGADGQTGSYSGLEVGCGEVCHCRLKGILPMRVTAYPETEPSVARQTDRRVFRVRRARLTFSRISVARAVQMKGLGLSL
jgi:hypothetical protein